MRKRRAVRNEPEPLPRTCRGAAEHALTDIQRALEGRQFGSEQELRALLDGVVRDGAVVTPERPETPLEKAQNLVFEAWEAGSAATRVRLARKALALSEDCADAYCILAEDEAASWLEALGYYRKAVAAAERAMGPGWEEEYAGHFWLALSTRPYMRARAWVAKALWELGQVTDAASEMEALLLLDPNDHLGIRSELATLYRQCGRFDLLADLIERHGNDIETWSAYDQALVLYAAEGPSPKATAAADRALRCNPHVQQTMAVSVSEADVPDCVDIGGPLDALAYCFAARDVWRRHDGALMWLLSRPAPPNAARRSARRRRTS